MMEERCGLAAGGPGGLVLNTASMAGILTGMDHRAAAYQISKQAVAALTISLGHSKVPFDQIDNKAV